MILSFSFSILCSFLFRFLFVFSIALSHTHTLTDYRTNNTKYTIISALVWIRSSGINLLNYNVVCSHFFLCISIVLVVFDWFVRVFFFVLCALDSKNEDKVSRMKKKIRINVLNTRWATNPAIIRQIFFVQQSYETSVCGKKIYLMTNDPRLNDQKSLTFCKIRCAFLRKYQLTSTFIWSSVTFDLWYLPSWLYSHLQVNSLMIDPQAATQINFIASK